jgi:hypothetical protein
MRPAPSARGLLKLDWFFARSLSCRDPAVVEAVHPGTGAALSDHEAIAVTVAATGSGDQRRGRAGNAQAGAQSSVAAPSSAMRRSPKGPPPRRLVTMAIASSRRGSAQAPEPP